MDYDMAPTSRLAGLHFEGTVARRWIASHALDPEQVPLPAGVEPWLDQGRLWVSDCFVQLRHMRPSGMPRNLGLPMRYLVHRTMAWVPFPDGVRRKAVFVLAAYADPPLARWLGRRLGGAPFSPAKIVYDPDGQVRVEAGGACVFEARYHRGWTGSLPLDEADGTILGMSFGAHHEGGWRIFPETHDPWVPEGWEATVQRHALFDAWGIRSQPDHVIGMADVPHYFARPVRVSEQAVQVRRAYQVATDRLTNSPQ